MSPQQSPKQLRAKNMNKQVNFLGLLPPQVLSKITARLPLKSIANCLLVCKLWLSAISNPVVARGDVQFLLFDRESSRFAFLDDDPTQRQRHIQPEMVVNVKTLSLPPGTRYGKPDPLLVDMRGVLSCNGLLFLPVKNYSLFYLYNPVIGEFALVPTPIIHDFHSHVYDLGYCPSTNTFKITRFVRRKYSDDTAELEIFTLGSPHGWRSFTGEVPNQFWLKSASATFSKGLLHWMLLLEGNKRSILTFDLEEERFGSVPLPPLDADKDIYQMGFMDNSLIVTAGYNPPLGLEIWARRDCVQGSVWTKNWVIDATESLNQKTIYTSKLILLIPRKVSIDGRIFMTYMDGQLLCYDPKTRHVQDFVFTVNDEDTESRTPYNYRDPLSPWSGMIAHTASLISPKSLIEAGGPVKIRRDKGKQKVEGTV